MFKINQKVVCVNSTWYNFLGDICAGPVKDSSYTVIGFAQERPDYIEVDAFPGKYYVSSSFRALEPKSAIKELVSIKIITETSDAPMKNPSPMRPLKELV